METNKFKVRDSMRYLVREKIFTIGDKFIITDEMERPKFQVVGKVFTFGNKLNIYNMNGENLIYIEEKIFRFLPEYNIYIGRNLAATVKKEFTLFKPKFNISSDFGKFTIDGDIFAYNFSIYRDKREVAVVNKKFFAWSDTYGVDIDEEENHAFILALVIVLDQVLHDNNNVNNNQ